LHLSFFAGGLEALTLARSSMISTISANTASIVFVLLIDGYVVSNLVAFKEEPIIAIAKLLLPTPLQQT
jgi:hypothetical protein